MLYHQNFANELNTLSWLPYTPLNLTLKGWQNVYIFFAISGFVLPIGYFKKPETSRVIQGIYRRYLRLMLPVLVVFVIIHVHESCMTQEQSVQHPDVHKARLSFPRTLYAGIFGLWKGDGFSEYNWSPATWTLFIELWASFYIYLMALLCQNYSRKHALYTFVLVFCFLGNFEDFLINKSMNR